MRRTVITFAALTTALAGCGIGRTDREVNEANSRASELNAKFSSLQSKASEMSTSSSSPKPSHTPPPPRAAVCPAPTDAASGDPGTRALNAWLGISYVLPEGYHENTSQETYGELSLARNGETKPTITIYSPREGYTDEELAAPTNEVAVRSWYKAHHDPYDFDYPSDQFTQWDGPNLPGAAYQGEERPNRADKPGLKASKRYEAYVGCQAHRWTVSSSTGASESEMPYDPEGADIVARSIRELRP